jgi:hypothetical protein
MLRIELRSFASQNSLGQRSALARDGGRYGGWPTALNILFRASGPPSSAGGGIRAAFSSHLVGADFGKPGQRSALTRLARRGGSGRGWGALRGAEPPAEGVA